MYNKDEKINVRNTNIDSMKGILIILVVLGHTYNKFCYGFISLFHVGLFFVLSGYCFNQKYSESILTLWDLFKKRIKSLWVPYVAYNFIFLLLMNILIKIGFLTSSDTYFFYEPYLNDGYCSPITIYGAIKAFIKSLFFINSRPFAGGLWFLGGLFYVTFLYAILQFILKKLKIEKFHIIFSIILLVLGWFIVKLGYIQKIPFLKQVSIIFVSEILFCIGSYVREYIIIPRIRILFYYVGFVLFFVVLCLLSTFGTISIASVNIKNPFFYLASILSGGGFIICLVKIIENMKMKKILRLFSYIGKNTIPILALHTLCFKIVTLIQIKYYNGDKILLALYPVWKNSFLWSFAYLLVGLLVPLLMATILSKSKFFKIVFKC